MNKLKVLYAIQGTGNGHISRAQKIIPILQKKVKLDILVSGIQSDIPLDYEVKYKFHGMSLVFGKKGGTDIWQTLKILKPLRLLKEIKSLPVENYDLVINDFEPVSAYACKFRKVPCVSFSHQSAVIHRDSPKPKKNNLFSKFILKNYAPTKKAFGIHFEEYAKNIFKPIIRDKIRFAETQNRKHYTVYLPAYSDEKIVEFLENFPNFQFEVFSKHNKNPIKKKNIKVSPINDDAFVSSMASSTGLICGAGFESPAEALFLKKKLIVIPMKNQYEQDCNAAALEKMGVPVLSSLDDLELVKNWLNSEKIIEVDYTEETEKIVNQIINLF